jgi:serine/threonine protein kinase
MVDDPMIGHTLAQRYRIEAMVGKGGWGRVYRARHLTLGHHVAVKVMHQNLLESAVNLKRFELEARAASQVDHVNVVKVSDFGLSPLPFLVMEYIEGQTLSQFIHVGRCELSVLLQIFCQLCHGVQAIHEAGFIHRDIKPSNVLLRRTDSGPPAVKISDFGMAKMVLAELDVSDITRTGDFVGSLPYASPEQCAGKTVDARSDIYSIGCVLYEAVAGNQVFVRESAFALINCHLFAKPEPINFIVARSRQSSWLEQVIFTCLEKDQSNRYQSAADLAADLQNILARRKPIGASKGKYGAVEAGRFSQKSRIAAIFAVSALIFATGIVLHKWHRISDRLWQSEFEYSVRLLNSQDYTDAKKALRQSYELSKQFERKDKRRLNCLRALIACEQGLNDKEDAAKLEHELAQETGTCVSTLWQNLNTRAWHLLDLGKLQEAKGIFQTALAEAHRYGSPNLSEALSLDGLSKAFLLDRNYAQSELAAQESLKIRQLLLDSKDSAIATSLANLAYPTSYLKRYAEADSLYKSAIVLAESSGLPEQEVVPMFNSRATNYIRWGRLTQAEGIYKSLILRAEKMPDPAGAVNVVTISNNMSELYRRMGRLEEARKIMEEAIKRCNASKGFENPDSQILFSNLGLICIQQNHLSEAMAAFNRAIELREKSNPRHPSLIDDYNSLANVLHLMGRSAESQKASSHAARLKESRLRNTR